MTREIFGKLHLYSETGTEGGYWALQDYAHIKKVTPEYGVWAGSEVWDQADPERHGKIKEDDLEVLKGEEWLPLPDPLQEEPDYYVSSLFCGETRGDREADQRLMEKYDFKIQYSEDQWNEKWGEGNWRYEDEHTVIAANGERYLSGGTPLSEPRRPYGIGPGELVRATVEWDDGLIEPRLSDSLLVAQWSYEGLHTLKNGDYLIIYDRHDSQIVWEGEIKLKQHPLFTEDASGLWIHADQKGIDREKWARWFFDGNSARLRTK